MPKIPKKLSVAAKLDDAVSQIRSRDPDVPLSIDDEAL